MTTEWTIDTLGRDPATGRVTVAHWRARRVVGALTAESCGATELLPGPTDPNDPAFVPFSEITESLAIQWLLNALSAPQHSGIPGVPMPSQMDEIEAYLDARIAEQQTPPSVMGTPW